MFQTCILFIAAYVFSQVQACTESDYDSLLASTKYGCIRGKELTSKNGRPFYSYTKIPYAQPPVGENRFRAPIPPEPWSDVLNAEDDAPACAQKNYLREVHPKAEGEEDCLYLNVYRPKVYEQERNSIDGDSNQLPVMVFIHWGAFFAGYGNKQYLGPEYFMDKDVILVTFNYRLGVFGFLSTADDAAPGNWGLKDQVAALRWVNENIHYFGGNNNSITIFGQSAGSGSVHYHMLSPSARGLFHGAIAQSGSALNLWAKPLNAIQATAARSQGRVAGCVELLDSYKLIECLRKVDAQKLLDSGDSFKVFNVEPLTVFGIVTEKKTEANPEPYITESPSDIIQRGDFAQVPFILGVVEDEGIIRASPLMRQTDTRLQLNVGFNVLMPNLLALMLSLLPTDIIGTWEKIKDFYFGGANIINVNDPNSVQGLINLYSDRSFKYGVYQSALLHAANGNSSVWFYNFGYRGEYSYGDYFAATDNDIDFKWGTSHCDDLLYLFRTPAIFPELCNSSDLAMMKLLITMWTNFATYRNPTPPGMEPNFEWEPVPKLAGEPVLENKKLRYLNITGSTTEGICLKIENSFIPERMTFWENLPLLENINRIA